MKEIKETKIEIPAGFEVDKTEVVNGALVVTFKEKERKLPKSWEEFCEMFPVKRTESYINKYGCILDFEYEGGEFERSVNCKNILPDRDTAEATLALCQLIQLRNVYNGDWVPDWTNEEKKWLILFSKNTIETIECAYLTSSVLYFKSEVLRDEFLSNFRRLIEKLKPLYGISL